MPWDSSPHAGFSSAEPWLPLNPDWHERNVAAQERDPGSMLALTRALLRLRRAEAALSVGDYVAVESRGTLLAFERRHGDARLLVALNLGAEPVTMPVTMPGAADGERLLSTLPDLAEPGVLRGNEGVVVRLA
jgi:glycosidase